MVWHLVSHHHVTQHCCYCCGECVQYLECASPNAQTARTRENSRAHQSIKTPAVPETAEDEDKNDVKDRARHQWGQRSFILHDWNENAVKAKTYSELCTFKRRRQQIPVAFLQGPFTSPQHSFSSFISDNSCVFSMLEWNSLEQSGLCVWFRLCMLLIWCYRPGKSNNGRLVMLWLHQWCLCCCSNLLICGLSAWTDLFPLLASFWVYVQKSFIWPLLNFQICRKLFYLGMI